MFLNPRRRNGNEVLRKEVGNTGADRYICECLSTQMMLSGKKLGGTAEFCFRPFADDTQQGFFYFTEIRKTGLPGESE